MLVGSAAMEQTRPSTSAVAAVPSAVRELVVAHLERVDEAAPGLIEMLYLTGSAALGDHRPGVSDVDFLAVTSRACRPHVADGLVEPQRERLAAPAGPTR